MRENAQGKALLSPSRQRPRAGKVFTRAWSCTLILYPRREKWRPAHETAVIVLIRPMNGISSLHVHIPQEAKSAHAYACPRSHLVVVDPVSSVRELNLHERPRTSDTLFEVLCDRYARQMEETDLA